LHPFSGHGAHLLWTGLLLPFGGDGRNVCCGCVSLLARTRRALSFLRIFFFLE
jgi:hypothetical protein